MSCPAHALAVTRRFLDYEDVDLIREMVAMLPVDRDVQVVDLGAGSGTTALAVLAERRERIAVVTVDHSGEALRWAGLAVKNAYGLEQWHGVEADSVDEAGAFADESVDLLLLDTSHEYEPTVTELNAWLPKVRPGSPVWLHDYRGEYPGVPRAVEEFVAAGRLRLHAVRGLGWGGFRV